MALESLQDLFVEQLQDLFDAEQQLVKAIPEMAKASSTDKLRKAFQMHLSQTEDQVRRLEQVFELLDMKPKGETCQAMQGLIREGKTIMKKDAEPAVLDAALIAAAQKVEHYEIASYGSVRTWAKELGYRDAANLLQETLEEESEANEKLTKIAESLVNPRAA
jgi:ferritin-like metal-binding protein YciE